MKVVHGFVGCISIVLFLSCVPRSPKTDLGIFRFDSSSIGIPQDDDVKLLELRGTWKVLDGPVLELPSDCRAVLGFVGAAIGFVRGTDMNLWLKNSDGWLELENTRMKVPLSARHFMDLGDQRMGYYYKGRFSFFYFGKEWEAQPQMDFIPEKGWDDVIAFGDDSLLVRKKSNLRMYQYVESSWKEIPSGAKTLPEGIRSVFAFSNTGIGLEYDDHISFEFFSQDVWEERKDVDLSLEGLKQ